MLCCTFTFNPYYVIQEGPRWDLNPGPSCLEVIQTQTIKTLFNTVVLRALLTQEINTFISRKAPLCQQTLERHDHMIVFKRTSLPSWLHFQTELSCLEKTEKLHLQQRWLSLGFKVSAKSSFLLLDVLGKYFICLILNWPLILTFL